MPYVKNERMTDLMTTAIEGGSAYWMNDDDVCKNVDVERDAEKNITQITCETDVDGEGWKPHTITAIKMRQALEAMQVSDKLPMHIRRFAFNMLNDPDHDYDAGDADNVLQYAMFTEIVFG